MAKGEVMEALQGWKTYLCAAVLILGACAYAVGIITTDQLKALWAIFGPLALAALKSGQADQTAKIEAHAAVVAKTLAASVSCDCPPRV